MPFHWPRHNYLGPGTKDFTKKPHDEDDEIAKKHDLAYKSAKTKEDIFKADKEAVSEFYNSFKKTWHPEALIGSAALKIKNFTEENIVGKPLYGMPQKNWAAIRRINQARSRRRQAEQSVDEAREESTREFGPVNIYDAETDTEPDMGAVDTIVQEVPGEPMDVMADQPRASGSGSGGSSGAGGSNPSDIYAGSCQNPNKHTKTFKKSYHFTVSNKLPEWRRKATGGHLEHLARYNSIHGIPWELLGMYMSEGEIEQILNNYSFVKVDVVNCKLYSLGVRLPFVTGQSVTTVANANAQYPIGKFHFDHDFQTSYEINNVYNIMEKCWGSEWKTQEITETNWSSSFPNLTASSTSRDMTNPVIVHYPRYSWLTTGAVEQYPKDVGIYDYCEIKNGSTVFGLAWEMSHKPKQGIIVAKSHPVVTGNLHLLNNTDAEEETPISGERANFIIGTDWYANRRNPNMVVKDWTLGRYDGVSSLRDLQVDNTGIYAQGDEKVQSMAMPKFMIGFVNVRNQDDTILEAKWDILVECNITLTCIDNGQRGFVTRMQRAVPYLMNPFLTWKDTETGSNRLHANSNMKNTAYNKRAMTRQLNISSLKRLIRDEKFKEFLNKTDEGKELLKSILDNSEASAKKYEEWSAHFKKHKHVLHEKVMNDYKDIISKLKN